MLKDLGYFITVSLALLSLSALIRPLRVKHQPTSSGLKKKWSFENLSNNKKKRASFFDQT
jgi:hypothetical protein